jgi:cell division protein FtsL
MAVYQGARPRTLGLPSRPRLFEAPTAAPTLPRRRARAAVRANRTVTTRPGLLLGLIVVAFMLAFFSLAQEVRVSATTYDIGRLQVEGDRLNARLQELRSDVSRLGREPAVRKLALDAGLGQLGEPIVLPAR